MTFNFGKLGDAFLKIGQSTLQTGMFYAAAKGLNSGCMGPSVWNCGTFNTGCYGGGMGMMNYGMNGFMGGCSSYQMLLNDPSTQMALGQAYGQGYALGEYLKQNPGTNLYSGYGMLNQLQQTAQQQKTLKPTNNEAAEKFTDHSTQLGKLFEDNIQKGEETRFVKTEWQEMEEGSEKDAKYKDYASNMAKSYIAHMDETSGNKDNEITMYEFVKYNQKVDLKDNATDAEKTALKQMAETAFKKMDQNGDGKIDWKEMAAVIGTYDASADGKHDGVINTNELQSITTLLTNKTSTTADEKFRTEYTRLFGDSKAAEEEEE